VLTLADALIAAGVLSAAAIHEAQEAVQEAVGEERTTPTPSASVALAPSQHAGATPQPVGIGGASWNLDTSERRRVETALGVHSSKALPGKGGEAS
jgi:hypothetical protein